MTFLARLLDCHYETNIQNGEAIVNSSQRKLPSFFTCFNKSEETKEGKRINSLFSKHNR